MLDSSLMRYLQCTQVLIFKYEPGNCIHAFVCIAALTRCTIIALPALY